MKLYSLRELFELRGVHSLNARTAFCRIFFREGLPGLSDATGAVWPVIVDPTFPISDFAEGAVYRISSFGPASHQEHDKGASSACEYLYIHEVSWASGNDCAAWNLQLVPDPSHAEFPLSSENKNSPSVFFSTPTSRRQHILNQRSRALSDLRAYFQSLGYLESDPPVLVSSGGVERYLNPFQTQYTDHRGQVWPMQLPTSPEFSLKKLVTEGVSKSFALTHSFRNVGELSKHHDPEFMILEWYRVSEDFDSLLIETQRVVERIASTLGVSSQLPGNEWKRFRVNELFISLLEIDLSLCANDETFRTAAIQKCSSITPTDSWDDVFCKLFMEFIEPFLEREKACFVTHYPVKMGALAAVSSESSLYVDRFELYLNGAEICNGYRELTSAEEFLSRADSVQAFRPDIARDHQFECCFAKGIYPCVGNALGVDRLIAVLLGKSAIQEILPWPFASRFLPNTVALE